MWPDQRTFSGFCEIYKFEGVVNVYVKVVTYSSIKNLQFVGVLNVINKMFMKIDTPQKIKILAV